MQVNKNGKKNLECKTNSIRSQIRNLQAQPPFGEYICHRASAALSGMFNAHRFVLRLIFCRFWANLGPKSGQLGVQNPTKIDPKAIKKLTSFKPDSGRLWNPSRSRDQPSIKNYVYIKVCRFRNLIFPSTRIKK